jgi:hypothetical protein
MRGTTMMMTTGTTTAMMTNLPTCYRCDRQPKGEITMSEQFCEGMACRKKGTGGRTPRPCAQKGIYYEDGCWWCFYHRPSRPMKATEGYGNAISK